MKGKKQTAGTGGKEAKGLPAWAGTAFKITSTDDVLDSFYAPSREVVEPKEEKSPPTPIAPDSRMETEAGSNSTPIEAVTQPQKEPSDLLPKKTEKTPRNLMGRSNRAAKEISRSLEQNTPVPSKYSEYTLKEILPGKALDLYAVLFERTHAAQPTRAKVRLTKNSLRAEANISNVKTANAHERYLIALGLVTRRSIAGDHDGSTYEVRRLQELGLNSETVAEFGDYLRARRVKAK